jgi:hypothetical protein
VSQDWPALTGPMHGLKSTVEVRSSDRVALIKPASSISNIITTRQGSLFFTCERENFRAFVSSNSEIPDVDQPLNGKGYDVRKQFVSAVPLIMYLKWAFRNIGWQANEAGACLILDDPLLRMKYGFCDFGLLDSQMRKHSFTTNIAMIPWNRRRTSATMASLVKKSGGRLSVSVHGCAHTAGEFGINNPDEICEKLNLAERWMEQHRRATGVAHDAIMIFPQGIFSKASLRTLQQHQFIAAVNTDVSPFQPEDEVLTVRDAWALAITRFSSFPLFTRRYPSDGLANFAFDILLGKPCLIVEHHSFFKNEHREVLRFADALNSLNGGLQWRSLGDVLKRSYEWRIRPDGVTQIRMFANEMSLKNGHGAERQYLIEKPDEKSAGVREVTANGRSLEWQREGYAILFTCRIPSGAEVLIRVQYTRSREKESRGRIALSSFVKIAIRRYLSEVRDSFYPAMVHILRRLTKQTVSD